MNIVLSKLNVASYYTGTGILLLPSSVPLDLILARGDFEVGRYRFPGFQPTHSLDSKFRDILYKIY